MENMTSPSSKAPYRGIASRLNSRGGGGGGGGRGGIHLTVPETTLHTSDFLVRKSGLRQIVNFLNYLGDYRHKSGEIRLQIGRLQTSIWRPRDMAQNLEITDINLESGRYSSKSGDSRIIGES